MSHTLYDLQWQQAVDRLKHLADLETVETPEELALIEANKNKPKSEEDNDDTKPTEKIIDLPREQAYDRFALLYVRYLQIFRDIEESYDQIVHPQKRRDIRIILDIVMVRMLQLKRKSIQYSFYPGSCWNYISLDKYATMLQLSLNGNKSDLDLVVPKYFLEEDLVDEERLELLEQIFSEKSESVKIPTLNNNKKYHLLHSSSTKPIQLTLSQALNIICKIERGRQAMQRAKVLEKLKCDQPLKKLRDEKYKIMNETEAAITIQRVYKGHIVRRQLQQKALNELLFLNMSLPNRLQKENDLSSTDNIQNDIVDNSEYHDLSLPKFPNNPYLKQNQIREKRVNLRIENEVEYERSIPDIRDNLILEQGPKIREHARQQRFDWAIKQRELKGSYPTTFDQFYVEQEALKNGIDLNAPKDDNEDDGKKKGKGKGKKGDDKKSKKDKKGKDDKKSKKDGKKGKGKKGKGGKGKKGKGGTDDGINEDDPFVHIQTPGLVKTEMKSQIEKIYKEWRNLDEKENFAQKHDVDFVKRQLLPGVVKQIELEVDQQLLQALDNLKVQLGIKTGKASKSKKGGKKGKKKGGKKKSKKKK